MNELNNDAACTHFDTAKIIGWGVDADPENNPTYPYRERAGNHDARSDSLHPSAQTSGGEILQSVEYNRRPAVFGTAVSPSGLSGVMRRAAFRWSESNNLHWLLLLGADRINVVEGVLQDLRQGRVPNIPREMGGKAEWRHNKKGIAKKIAVVLAVSGGLALLRSRGSKAASESRRA